MVWCESGFTDSHQPFSKFCDFYIDFGFHFVVNILSLHFQNRKPNIQKNDLLLKKLRKLVRINSCSNVNTNHTLIYSFMTGTPGQSEGTAFSQTTFLVRAHTWNTVPMEFMHHNTYLFLKNEIHKNGWEMAKCVIICSEIIQHLFSILCSLYINVW